MSDQLTFDDQESTIRLKAAWQQALARLTNEMPETVVRRFLKPLEPAGYANGTAVLDAPGQFVQEWVKEKYVGQICRALEDELGEPIRLELRTRPRERPAQETRAQNVVVTQPLAVEPPGTFVPNDKFRFESFVVGQSNRLACAGARAIAMAPGKKYNPFFIYGASGLGKTHLLHAIAHEIHHRDPNCRVTYITGQQFAEEFVLALQNNRIEMFRKAQRGVQVWLLDDVQFIAGKERTQEEVFHTFNYLYALNKQIVLCSDRPPRDLLLMDERLRSRFEAGLVADVQLPDTETRCAILQKKAAEEHLELPHEVAMFLAESVPGNVRILEGAMNKLGARASLEGLPLTIALAEEIVEKYYQRVGMVKPSFDQILETVGRHLRVPVTEIKGVSRKAPVAFARHVAVYVTREVTGDSWKHIGILFGDRDHTSMMHGYKKIRGRMHTDKELNASVRRLINDLVPEI